MPRHTTRKVISQMFKLTRIIAASATAAGFACAQTTVSEPLHNPEHVELVTTDKPTFALSGELLSAYLDNGVTASAGPVFQPAAEIAYHGLFASFWGNYNLNDRKGLVRAGEFSQADWSAGYRMTFFEDTFEVALGFGQSIYFGPTKGEREDMPMLDLAWHGPFDWYLHLEHVVGKVLPEHQMVLVRLGLGIGVARNRKIVLHFRSTFILNQFESKFMLPRRSFARVAFAFLF